MDARLQIVDEVSERRTPRRNGDGWRRAHGIRVTLVREEPGRASLERRQQARGVRASNPSLP
jgi:hypothetical protein